MGAFSFNANSYKKDILDISFIRMNTSYKFVGNNPFSLKLGKTDTILAIRELVATIIHMNIADIKIYKVGHKTWLKSHVTRSQSASRSSGVPSPQQQQSAYGTRASPPMSIDEFMQRLRYHDPLERQSGDLFEELNGTDTIGTVLGGEKDLLHAIIVHPEESESYDVIHNKY